MVESPWKPEWTDRAQVIWAEYQREHDVSALKGQPAGVDPQTGQVWLGESIKSITEEMDRLGVDTPLLFVRIGYPCYFRKVSRRRGLAGAAVNVSVTRQDRG